YRNRVNIGQKLSEDLCWRVVYLHNDRFSEHKIANTLYISQSTISKILQNFRRWGCVTNPFKDEEIVILKQLVCEKVDWYLDELVYEMKRMTEKCALVAALWRSLKYCGITRKKLHKAAQERNERACSTFIAKIGESYTRDQLIFIDESAKDKRSLICYYRYSSVNTRAQKKIVFI
ncbi:32328_t:CDS:2, partial [Gigaspora margarita]